MNNNPTKYENYWTNDIRAVTFTKKSETDKLKWTKHIDSLIQRTSKQLNVLRKLKFRLKREYLENIYFTFIRPILEYSSEVWDNSRLPVY
jgi:hypothetical protein